MDVESSDIHPNPYPATKIWGIMRGMFLEVYLDMPLTDTRIRTLKPSEKPFKISDSGGLFLLVNPNGSLLWRFKYRYNKREKLLALGKYPLVSLKDARQRRDAAKLLLVDGIDPSEERKARKRREFLERGVSFNEIAAEYLAKLQREGRAAQTLKKVEWLISLAAPRLGPLDIKEIDARDILACLKLVESEGRFETANRLRSTIGSIMRYAIATARATEDPTTHLKGALIAPRAKHRAAIVNKPELGQLMRDIDAYAGERQTAIGLKLLALFATRPSELRLAQWDEFDLEDLQWTIPAERMKMRRPHCVPLSVQAVGLLSELQTLRGNESYVFASPQSWRKPISENTFNAALRRMGYPKEKISAHGFRASFSTLANESGKWHPDAIERALGHVESNEVRRAYARGEHWDERVAMAQWWADELDDYKDAAHS